MRRKIEKLVAGAVAGASAAGVMTVLRLAARRAGVIDKTVPQVVGDWVARRADARGIPAPIHHVADTLLHLGYGAVWGAAWGLARGRRAGQVGAGTLFGVGVWGVGFLFLAPALGITRPAWRAALGENTVNVAAHLAYGAGTALIAGELLHQHDRGALSDARRTAQPVG